MGDNRSMARVVAWLDLVFSITFLFTASVFFFDFLREGTSPSTSSPEEPEGNDTGLIWCTELLKITHAIVQLCMAILFVSGTKEGLQKEESLRKCLTWRNVNIALLLLYGGLCLPESQWARVLIVLIFRTIFFIVAEKFISEISTSRSGYNYI